MKKIIKGLMLVLASLLSMTALFLFSLRFFDGPLELFPQFTISFGGHFKSGTITEPPEDWSFLTDREKIQFQTLQPPISRTVWLAVHDTRLFIVSGYMNTNLGRLWKQWPKNVEDDDRVVLRVGSNLYIQRLERIIEGTDIVPVMSEISRKYGNGEPGSDLAVTSGYVWMFEVKDR
jgi:hypothetical protein